MIQNYLRLGLLLLCLLAMQILVFNHVHIMGYATPLVLGYFIFVLPIDTARWARLLWGFGLGLVQDIFAGTPGMMAATLTLIALIQPPLFNLLSGLDDTGDREANLSPSIATLGRWPFLRYAGVGLLIQCVVFYLLETFSFFSPIDLIINIAGSSVLSFLIVWGIESIRSGGGARK